MFSFVANYMPSRVLQGLTATYFKVSAFRQNGLRGTHTSQTSIQLNKMKITILPALSDNYMYLITDEATNEAAIVDPVDPDSALQAVQSQKVNLTKILTTHHHWDHAGGNQEMVKRAPRPLTVYGGDERVGGLTSKVKHGDTFKIGNIQVECLSTPCHTTDHICYFLTAPNQAPVVFTGDTLFIAGCGRFFEGTAEEMYTALIGKLSNLPDETMVFCGHEYTVQNLKFAKQVEGNNQDVLAKIAWANEQRGLGRPTVPSTIGGEKKWNPFMRVKMGTVQSHANCTDPIGTMKAIRKEKDNFKG